MEGKFPSKILAFVMIITHNCDSFFCWPQIFHILSSICEDFILPSQIRFFKRAFWVRHKFLVANRHFFCSDTLPNFDDAKQVFYPPLDAPNHEEQADLTSGLSLEKCLSFGCLDSRYVLF